MKRAELLLAALLLSLGIAGAGYFIGWTLYNAKVAINVTSVKGLDERRLEADRARWKIGYLVVGGDKSEIPSLYDKPRPTKPRSWISCSQTDSMKKIFHLG